MTAKWIEYKAAMAQHDPTPERLRAGLCWAVCTVHSSVRISEREFEAYWYHGRLPRSLPTMRTRALADVERFMNRLDFQHFLSLSLSSQLTSIVQSVHGLSYAKAAFALDCSRVANVACLDVWMVRTRLHLDRAPNWRNAEHYLDLVEQAFGCREGSGTLQWKAFMELPTAFRSTNHEVVFRAMGVETERQLTMELEV